MVSTMHLESLGGVNNWDWAKASKIKSGLRAPRRPKVYSAQNKKKIVGRNLKDSEDLTSISSKVGEMSVLESEKVGVSILGRRFSDSSQNVPIKKRRYLRLQFPSPPCSPSNLPEASECSLACEGSGLPHLHHFNVEHQGSSSDRQMDSCPEKSVTNENAIHDMPTDGADFSGISILAAAACNSSAVGDIISSKASVAREQDEEAAHLISGKVESHDLQGDKLVDQHLNNANALGIKTSIPVATMATSVLSKEDEDTNTTGESEVVEEQLSYSHSKLVSSNEIVGKISSARDGKFHWDLNKTIDTWEDLDAGLYDSEDPLVLGSSKDDVKSDGVDRVPMSSGSVKSPSKIGGDVYLRNELIGIGSGKDFDVSAEKDLSVNHGNVSQPSVVLIGDSAQTKHLVSEDLNKVGDERHASNDSRTEHFGCESVISSYSQSVDHPHETIASGDLSNSNCETFIETLCSHQDFIRNTCTANDNRHSGPSNLVNPPVRVRVVQDNEQALAVDTFNVLSYDTPVNGPTTSTQNIHHQPDSQKIDPKTVAGTCTGDHHMPAPLLSDPVIDKNSVKKFTGTDSCNIVGQSGLVEDTSTSSGPCQHDRSEQLVGLVDQGSPIPVELSSASNCAVKGAGDSNLNVQVQKSTAVVDANLNPELLDFVNDSGNKVIPIDYCAPCNHLEDASTVVKISGENCSTDHFDSDSVSSQHHLEKQAETEKDELHGDDDSQYEDGEFREPALLDWEIDGSEGEAEHVDYGSDSNRDDELVASSPNCHSFVHQLPLCETGQKSEKPLEVGSLHSVGEQTSTWVAPKHYHSSNIGAEKKKPLMEKVEREHSRVHDGEQSTKDVDDLQVCLNNKIVGCELDTENSDGAKVLSHAASSKMKPSGWDCLQEHPKATQVAVAETRSAGTEVNQSVATDTYPESHKNAGSMLRTDVSSRIGRAKSSELSQRKIQAHLSGKGANPDVSSTRIERDGSRTSSTRRDGSSLHRHDRRGRAGDACDESSGQWGPGWHKSPGSLESSGFNQSKLKNDTATVKVESNGFNAAPDGTVERRSVDCVSRTSRQSVNPSLLAQRQSLPKGVSPKERNESSDIERSFDFGHSREVSPDRHVGTSRGRPGRYDPRVLSTDHRERYVGPISGEGIDSSSSIRHTFSRRECNYSPHRNSIRTWACSPQVWTSPRRRDDGGMNGLRRWNRSPDFRSPSFGVSPNERNDSSDLDRSLDFGHSRDRSPDRHLIPSRGRPGSRYDPRVVSVGRKERWKRFPEPISGDGIDSSLPICHSFSRRDHNYSPQRNSINMWSRSPHVWMSPRRKDDGDMNDLKRSRYPNFRSAERGERMRLPPQQQPRYLERMPDMVPSSGSNVSPPPALRWIDHGKDLEHHFGEHEYRQSSGRNHPGRPFPRDHRFDIENSHQIKAEEEYHRPSDPGRIHDFSVSRRQRSGGRNNRGHGSRFDIFDCPSAQYDDVDDIKHVNYDIDDGFRLNDSRYKDGLNFDERGSPREFDRGIEGHLDSPPRRPRDHERPFRYRRDARESNSFRPFRIRECDDDVNQRRRLQ